MYTVCWAKSYLNDVSDVSASRWQQQHCSDVKHTHQDRHSKLRASGISPICLSFSLTPALLKMFID